MDRVVRLLLRRGPSVISALAALALVASCGDSPPVAPRTAAGHASFALSPSFAKIPPGGPNISLATLRATLVATNGERFDQDAPFVDGVATLTIEVPIIGAANQFELTLHAFDDNGEVIYSTGAPELTLHAGNNPSPDLPPLFYDAADAGARVLQIVPESVTLDALASTTLTATGTTGAGDVISPVRVGWTSRDPTVATVDEAGVVTAGPSQGTTMIVARMATDVADSIVVTVHAPVSRIVVTPATLQLTRGTTGTVSAELRDAADHLIDDRAATWTSSDPTVASVSPTGTVTANKIGTATLTATAEGKSATVAVTVVTPVDHIELTPSTLRLTSLGQTGTLAATIIPVAGGSITGLVPTFTSDAPAIATVDAQGVVKAVANGSATITAALDGVSATAQVTVAQVVARASISPTAATIPALGGSTTFTAAFFDAGGSPISAPTVTWTSANSNVATVSGSGLAGVVTGLHAGTSAITATSGGKSASATVTVQRTATGLVVGSDKTTIATGQSASLSATFTDSDGPIGPAAATYSTTTPEIATIVGNTLVGRSPGIAHVVGTAGALSASIDIEVTGSPGGNDLIVFNDMNAFDNANGVATGGANQPQFFRNLVNFTGTGPRASQHGVMLFRGHNALCVVFEECSSPNYSTFTATLAAAGYTVTDVNTPEAVFEVAVDPSIKVLMLLTPTVSFASGEIAILQQFLAEGGRLVFVGEHAGFYGEFIESVQNSFLSGMGASLRANSSILSCGPRPTGFVVPASSIRAHQITVGLTGLSIPCASEMTLGQGDVPLFYDQSGAHVLGAVAALNGGMSGFRVRPMAMVVPPPPPETPYVPPVTGTNTPPPPGQ